MVWRPGPDRHLAGELLGWQKGNQALGPGSARSGDLDDAICTRGEKSLAFSGAES